MVEAVYSSVSTSTLIRATAEQASNARSISAAAAANKVQAAPQAPYVSPYIGVDRESQKIVLQIRNGDTGKVIEQIPSSPSLDEPKAQAPAPQEQQQAQGQPQTAATPTQTPAASTASFGAFAKQVASLQTAISGAGTGGTVSISA